ncbi:MAG TPA: phosphoglycerate kinase [Syntrophorhabdaceae bacterium]|nr:phosphoglycerate kinase [Syntrophorhabdaceae bacterium]HOL04968.1 phosphoglycerate kinase [Syntrophorhabdaceae bacterium]HON85200.1 phosphoglycerate kinase [Syntrophorhabdaceae bacterium]HOT41997.1 phosphoglycerate kinase [Syntrophorhabdaceae bacterium]HPC66554.1 phosphoglycerate kinase [Syntrophorhabdaceae bacterium]
MKYIDQIDIKDKRVFIRVDFNVPMDDKGNITDDTRIKAHLPTINYAIEKGAKVIVGSHLGRPKGKRSEAFSLKAAAKRLSELIKKDVLFLDDCIGEAVEKAVSQMKTSDVVLLENLRFHLGEEKNDPEFAKQLARLCDVYVDDAFAVSHRKAASNTAIVDFVDVCAAGFLLKDELAYFDKAMGNPVRPLVAIIGGAKVSDKIGVLEKLVEKVDKLIVGGGMAFTFLKALGYEIGNSICEENMLDLARGIMDKARARDVKFYLPVDCVVAEKASADAETKICTVQEIPKGWMGLDIGPASVSLFSSAIQNAKTILWNGPMGMFELDPFSRGTFAMVTYVANSHALTIIGGGDTDVAVHRAGESDKISYISTGGGAFLELLEGKPMPAIEALEASGGAK